MMMAGGVLPPLHRLAFSGDYALSRPRTATVVVALRPPVCLLADKQREDNYRFLQEDQNIGDAYSPVQQFVARMQQPNEAPGRPETRVTPPASMGAPGSWPRQTTRPKSDGSGQVSHPNLPVEFRHFTLQYRMPARRRNERHVEEAAMSQHEMQPKKTIDEVLNEFLAEQKAGLGRATFAKHARIIHLLKSYCEGCWPGHEGDFRRVVRAGGGYCGSFGPEDVLGAYRGFLGRFMPGEAMASKETMRAAGTVTKKLASWLEARGYVADAGKAIDEAKRAANELPASREVLSILAGWARAEAPRDDECERYVEDRFWVRKVEPGRLWLEPFAQAGTLLGPVPVPEEASVICQEGWEIRGLLGETAGGWRVVEVRNVAP